MSKAVNLDQLKQFAQRSKAETSTLIDSKMSMVYKPMGSVTFANLPPADQDHLGMVYNVTDAFTTTADYLEGAGKDYPAGTNVGIVAEGSGFKYDALMGIVDTSNFVTKESGKGLSTNDFTDADKNKLDGLTATEFASDSEFTAMLDSVYNT